MSDALIRQLLDALSAGPFVRVLVVETRGSAPREAGAEMIVRQGALEGTIGGGALEWQALDHARALLAEGGTWTRRLERIALGPALGQCCGGAVTVLFERFDEAARPLLEKIAGRGTEIFARPLESGAPPALGTTALPPALHAVAAILDAPALAEGWIAEPAVRRAPPLWIWGAGHVGREIVDVLAPLGAFAIRWADLTADRFPEEVPAGVETVAAADLPLLAAHAPREAHHLIVTRSHELDLALCHALLGRGAASIGLIGSQTKRARFARRLAALGHGNEAIAGIICPIGTPALGKHPRAIAIGVAHGLLLHKATGDAMRPPQPAQGQTPGEDQPKETTP